MLILLTPGYFNGIKYLRDVCTMKIQSINYYQQSIYTNKGCKKRPLTNCSAINTNYQILGCNTKTNDSFKSNNINFRGEPWVLSPGNYGIPEEGSITASQGIKLYDKLKCGNYLDIGNDRDDFRNCNKIRERNLTFLDRITDTKEKEKFIDYYKELTGFPNLKKVSENIKDTFKSAVKSGERAIEGNNYHVCISGYDGICSVGRNKALPGSDLDKAYVILDGKSYLYSDEEIVDKFKEKLWFDTDQRILSYNHDEAAFPQVYTKRQIEALTDAIEKKDIEQRSNFLWFEFKSPASERQLEILSQGIYMEDYIKANPYFIEYCRKFPKRGNDRLDITYPSRENIKNVGFVIETLREGESLYGYERPNLDGMTYQAANLSQLAALKKRGDRKPKRLERESLERNFPKWDIDKQFRFIQTMIKSACANNRVFTHEFANYFSKPGQDLFAPLIYALMR